MYRHITLDLNDSINAVRRPLIKKHETNVKKIKPALVMKTAFIVENILTNKETMYCIGVAYLLNNMKQKHKTQHWC